jgi:hypothetical protein
MKNISRRDFLKSAGALLLGSMIPGAARALLNRDQRQGDVIVLLFDTMSARNLSLYGYRRGTTPNLERFAERATVYHQHISAGNYTTPGTASILTGTYPWTHRAINQGGIVLRDLKEQNIFSLFHPERHCFAFSQNLWAEYLIDQFENSIDSHLLPGSFSVVEKSGGSFFHNDGNISYRALDDFLFQTSGGVGSLVFGPLEKEVFLYRLARISKKDYMSPTPSISISGMSLTAYILSLHPCLSLSLHMSTFMLRMNHIVRAWNSRTFSVTTGGRIRNRPAGSMMAVRRPT